MVHGALLVIATALGQQPGHLKDNKKPSLPTQICTAPGQCTTQQTSVVLDGNWMWTHSTSGSTNCYTGDEWDTTICPDPVACAQNCALDGGDYADTYGISVSDDTLSLRFATKGQYGMNVGSRTYLMSESGDKYQMFKLKNSEFAFDVDVSTLPCGLNGALYFVEMDEDGGMSKYPNNKAGAAYGTGYCDAQCPHDIKFINGEANILNWTISPVDKSSGTGHYGSCCTEMDVWESNSISQALTPHTCDDSVVAETRCEGAECGDDAAGQRENGVCDKDGGDLNPYRNGVTNFYGPGANFNIDTTKPFTVVTQWVTNDGTDTGTLSEIRRFYVQDGKKIASPSFRIGGATFDSVTDDYVNDQKTLFKDPNAFEKRGGLEQMGKALERGMVLVLSFWADYAVNMLWLDSTFPPTRPTTDPGVARGTCATTSGDPGSIIQNNPDATVKYGNIKWGPIGSTYGPPAPPGPAPPAPPGPAPPGPPPSGCPGGSLAACIALCPSDPPAVYKACVESCAQRCTVEVAQL